MASPRVIWLQSLWTFLSTSRVKHIQFPKSIQYQAHLRNQLKFEYVSSPWKTRCFLLIKLLPTLHGHRKSWMQLCQCFLRIFWEDITHTITCVPIHNQFFPFVRNLKLWNLLWENISLVSGCRDLEMNDSKSCLSTQQNQVRFLVRHDWEGNGKGHFSSILPWYSSLQYFAHKYTNWIFIEYLQ